MSLTRPFINTTATVFNFLNDTISSTGPQFSSTGISNHDNDENDSSTVKIDFSSTEVIIGVSGIATGMLLILIFFFVTDRKNRKTTQQTFNCIIKKNNPSSLGEHLLIPKLNMSRELTAQDLELIETEGARYFCKNEIEKTIAKKRIDDEPIQSDYLSTQVVKVFFKNTKGDLGKFDFSEDIIFEYDPSNNHCNFFGKVLPPLTRATLLFEMLFGTVQMLGSLQLMSPVLPISREINNKIIIAQTILDLLFMLFMVFTGPGMAFMGDLGTSIDNFFVNLLWKKKPKNEKESNEVESKNNEIKPSGSTKTKIIISKTLLYIFVLNSLYSQVINDYQSTMSLNDRINNLEDSIIPPWIVYLCSMIEFGLNQLNDPINIMSQIFMGTMVIDAYFSKINKPKAKVNLEEIKTDAMDKLEGTKSSDVDATHLAEDLQALPKSDTSAQLQADLHATLLPSTPKKMGFCHKLFSCRKKPESKAVTPAPSLAVGY